MGIEETRLTDPPRLTDGTVSNSIPRVSRSATVASAFKATSATEASF